MNPHDIRKLAVNTTINEPIQRSNVDLPELDLSGCKFTARVEFIHCAFEGRLGAHYEVAPYQLLEIPNLFLALSTLVFIQDGAVMAQPEPGERVRDAGPIKLDVNRAFGVSVSQFLPVEIPVGPGSAQAGHRGRRR